MSEIVSFSARARTDRKDDPIPPEGAKILFFTGVRYVRDEVAADKPPRPAGGGKSANGKNRRRRA